MEYRIFISIVNISANLENIDIDKAILKNSDIDKAILKNIDIDRAVPENIDIDKGRVQKKNSYKAVRSGHPPPA